MAEESTVAVELIADRLYGISYKPHELSMFGEKVNFHLRWSPIVDDAEALATTHYRLMVLEITTTVPETSDHPLRGQVLELLKIGWEVELTTAEAVCATALDDPPAHIRHALERIAETVNDLARRAGYQAPLGTDVVDSLLVASSNPQVLDD